MLHGSDRLRRRSAVSAPRALSGARSPGRLHGCEQPHLRGGPRSAAGHGLRCRALRQPRMVAPVGLRAPGSDGRAEAQLRASLQRRTDGRIRSRGDPPGGDAPPGRLRAQGRRRRGPRDHRGCAPIRLRGGGAVGANSPARAVGLVSRGPGRRGSLARPAGGVRSPRARDPDPQGGASGRSRGLRGRRPRRRQRVRPHARAPAPAAAGLRLRRGGHDPSTTAAGATNTWSPGRS